MVDLRVDDPRVERARRLGLPAVVVGGPVENRALPAVWHDEGVVDRRGRAVPRRARPHPDRARSPASQSSVHTKQRIARVQGAATRARARRRRSSRRTTAPSSGARATRRLLTSPEPPTAIIFDSDLLAVTGLGVAQQMGFSVPDDLSIVGWDDSLISRVVHPPLTAVTRDIEAYGIAADAAASRGHRRPGAPKTSRRVRGELMPRGSTARLAQAAAALASRRVTGAAEIMQLTLNRISDGLRQRMRRCSPHDTVNPTHCPDASGRVVGRRLEGRRLRRSSGPLGARSSQRRKRGMRGTSPRRPSDVRQGCGSRSRRPEREQRGGSSKMLRLGGEYGRRPRPDRPRRASSVVAHRSWLAPARSRPRRLRLASARRRRST